MTFLAEKTGAALERDLALLFGFVLTYDAYTRDQAFHVTVEASTKTVEGERRSPERVRIELFREALVAIRRRPPAGNNDLSAFFGLTPGRTREYEAIRCSLITLEPRLRAPLLLSDLCRFSPEAVSAVLGAPAGHVWSDLDEARHALQSKLRDFLGRDADQYRGIVDALQELGSSAPTADLMSAVAYEKKKIHAAAYAGTPKSWLRAALAVSALAAFLVFLWLRSS